MLEKIKWEATLARKHVPLRPGLRRRLPCCTVRQRQDGSDSVILWRSLPASLPNRAHYCSDANRRGGIQRIVCAATTPMNPRIPFGPIANSAPSESRAAAKFIGDKHSQTLLLLQHTRPRSLGLLPVAQATIGRWTRLRPTTRRPWAPRVRVRSADRFT
jgi:hypothetical protein